MTAAQFMWFSIVFGAVGAALCSIGYVIKQELAGVRQELERLNDTYDKVMAEDEYGFD